LSIVRNLVELHGGSVRVKSPGENQGATFIVALPLSVVEKDYAAHNRSQLAVQEALDAIDLPSLEGALILVVDDEPDTRLLLKRLLEDRGARVLSAGSAPSALGLLAQEEVDLLVSDIGMPGTDGYQLIEQVRTMDHARLAPLPAIAVTAYARAEDRQRSLLAGYQMHISKPVEARELIAGIASLLRLSR